MIINYTEHPDGRAIGATPYVQCTECKTLFRGHVKSFACNNYQNLTSCPWCKPDSEPWKDGRGA